MLTAAELSLLVQEVARHLGEARLKKIYEAVGGNLVLRFHRTGGDDDLVLVALEGGHPRVNLVAERPPILKRPPPFVEALRRELGNSRLSGIDTLPGDRVVRLDLLAPRGAAGPVGRRLVVELLPRARNVILLDESGVVITVREPRGGRRPVEPGVAYAPPEPPPRTGSEDRPFAFLDGPAEGADLAAAVEAHIGPKEAEELVAAEATRLISALSKVRKKERRLQSRLETELDRLGDPDAIRHLGEVLKTGLDHVPRGAESVELTDFGDPGQGSVRIPLDPKLGARGNMERLFKNARRAERARPRLEGRLEACRERLAAIERLIADARAAGSVAVVAELAERARGARLVPPEVRRPAASPSGAQGGRLPYRAFTSRDGWDILVGRTAADNDELTFRVANGNDYWMHVGGFAGSHVVVRDRGELPQETLLDAATLAVHYSKAPAGGKHEVSWTRRKWVRKFKGAHAGQVMLARRRTLLVRLEPGRLARLMGKEPGESR